MDNLKLSKVISHALRHVPLEYGLEIDKNGWVKVEQLLYALRSSANWSHLKESDLYTQCLCFSLKYVSDRRRNYYPVASLYSRRDIVGRDTRYNEGRR